MRSQYKEPDEEVITDPIQWIETHFWIPETSSAIKLLPYQKAVLREAYRRDEQGKFVYSVIVWSDIKKSAKSSIAAAVALERARNISWGSIKIVANDLKQADSRVAFYARRAVELNPALKDYVRHSPTTYRLEFPNRAKIEAIPVDPSGEAGGNDDLIIFSELWAAKNKAAKQMWTEMTLSPTKMGYSQRWVETYAGYSGESETLEQLYEQGTKHGRLLDLGVPGLEVFANDAARLLCLWNTVPRCPWQTEEYYAQESAILVPEEFDRVHRNQWGSSSQRFISIEWWDAARAELPPIGRYQPMVVSLDAATSSDCFGSVGLTRTGDQLQVRFVRKWQPSGTKLEFSNPHDPNDPDTPEGVIRWLANTFNVVEFCYDEYQLHDLCSRLRRDGVGHFLPFSQGSDRLIADKALYDLIAHRAIIHDGNAELRDHLANANRKDDGAKLRIIKRSETQKIDLAVCLSMAAHEAKRLNLE